MPNNSWDVGDLVHEKHHPDRMGVVIAVLLTGSAHSTKLAVQWTGYNPNQWKPGRPEIIDSFYLVKVHGVNES